MKKWIALLLSAVFFCLTGCGSEQTETITPTETVQEVSAQATETEAFFPVPSGRRIKDQTFEVELDNWGTVTFASYAPEDSGSVDGRYPDVRFYLLEGNTVLYEFPGWNPEHFTADLFVRVNAIAFRDYNDDGLLDVIAICEYESANQAHFQTARVYYQLEDRKGFEEDMLLTEYLSKQHQDDCVQSVMDAKAEYWDYVSAMDGHRSAHMQMQVIAENTQMWLSSPDVANDICRYAIADLDGNGRYEVIVSNMGGTGHYTYSRFFEVNAAYNGLSECETGFTEYDSQPDIIVDSLDLYISDDGEFYYAVFDLAKNGVAEYYESINALHLKDGKVASMPIAYRETIYTNGTPNVTCRNSVGANISETEYENAVCAYFAGYEKRTICLGWRDIAELSGSTEEIAAKLALSYDVYLNSDA